MRIGLLVVFLIVGQWMTAQQEQYKFRVANQDLKTALDHLQKEHTIYFSYSETLVEGLQAPELDMEGSLEVALTSLFQGLPIDFDVTDGQYVILKQRIAAERLFCGYLKLQKDSIPLEAAIARIKGKSYGASSTASGYFTFTAPANSEKEMISIRHVGYEPLEVPASQLLSGSCKTFYLKEREFAINSIKLTEYLSDGIDQSEFGNVIEISPNRIPAIPGFTEPDIFRAVQLLPGVSNAEGTASALSIHGGSPDQNLILWDNIPVYHTGHFFDMISAVNPYIVDKVRVDKSGKDPSHGGRAAGVILIDTGKAIDTTRRLGGGFNFTQAQAFAQLPGKKQKTAWNISGRRSLDDVISLPTFDKLYDRVLQGTAVDFDKENAEFFGTRQTTDFVFEEVNTSFKFKPSENTYLGVSYFLSNNRLDYVADFTEFDAKTEDELDISNTGFGVEWAQSWSPKHSSSLTGTFSDYKYDYLFKYIDLVEPTQNVDEQSENSLTDIGIKYKSNWILGQKQLLTSGLQWQMNKVNYVQNNVNFFSDEEAIDTWSAFTQWTIQQPEKYQVQLGGRLNRISELDKWRFEPRLFAEYHFTDALKLSGSASTNSQAVSQIVDLSFNTLGLQQKTWAIATQGNNGLPLLTSKEINFNASYKLNTWFLEADVYTKDLDGLTTLSNNFNQPLAVDIMDGGGTINGFDLLVKKNWRNYRTWLSYTNIDADYTFPTIQENMFNAPNISKHQVNWTHLMEIDRWSFSAGYNYRSGVPFTAATDLTEVVDNKGTVIGYELDIDNYFDDKFEDSHRLDASVFYELTPKEKGKWVMDVGVSAFNITDQKRGYRKDYFVQFDNNSDPQLISTNRLYQRFTPNVAVNITFE